MVGGRWCDGVGRCWTRAAGRIRPRTTTTRWRASWTPTTSGRWAIRAKVEQSRSPRQTETPFTFRTPYLYLSLCVAGIKVGVFDTGLSEGHPHFDHIAVRLHLRVWDRTGRPQGGGGSRGPPALLVSVPTAGTDRLDGRRHPRRLAGAWDLCGGSDRLTTGVPRARASGVHLRLSRLYAEAGPPPDR